MTPIKISRKKRTPQAKFAWLGLPNGSGSPAFWALALLIVLSFLLGGSYRIDVATSIVLRPAAAMIGAIGLFGLRRDQVRANLGLLVFAGACVALVALQLVPLPATLFQALGGRDLIGAIDRASVQAAVVRPMTVSPLETWNALWSLTVPIAALILAIQLDTNEHRKVLILLLIMGAVSGVLAVAQINSDPGGSLYFFESAKSGGALGVFANKNHQAVFLATMIPLLAALRKILLRRLDDRKKVWALNGAFAVMFLAFVPLLLITDSRDGLFAGVVAALASGWAFRGFSPTQTRLRLPARLALVTGVAGMFVLAIFTDRAFAWERFFNLNPVDDMRYRILPLVHNMITSSWPWGYGIGSFEKLYMMNEPDYLLTPSYMSHVNDDWLDVPMTTGITGIFLALWALASVCRLSARVMFIREARTVVDLGRAAVIGFGLLALSSLVDYPLRTSAVEAETVLFAVWLVAAGRFSPNLARIIHPVEFGAPSFEHLASAEHT